MKWTMSILAAAVMTAWAGVAAQSNSSMNREIDGERSARSHVFAAPRKPTVLS